MAIRVTGAFMGLVPLPGSQGRCGGRSGRAGGAGRGHAPGTSSSRRLPERARFCRFRAAPRPGHRCRRRCSRYLATPHPRWRAVPTPPRRRTAHGARGAGSGPSAWSAATASAGRPPPRQPRCGRWATRPAKPSHGGVHMVPRHCSMEFKSVWSVYGTVALASNFLRRIADFGSHLFLTSASSGQRELRDRRLRIRPVQRTGSL
jgi:hypothetical protein